MLENCDSGEGDLGWKHDRGLAGAASGENVLGGRGPILNSLPDQTGRGGSGGSEAGGSRPDEVRRVSRQPGRGRAAAGPGQGPELPGSCPRMAPAAGAGPGRARTGPRCPGSRTCSGEPPFHSPLPHRRGPSLTWGGERNGLRGRK